MLECVEVTTDIYRLEKSILLYPCTCIFVDTSTMPELAEVARVIRCIRVHLIHKTITALEALDDDMIFGKSGITASDFEKAMIGKQIVNAEQQGKYFWLIMSSPPHPVMHLGMTGWLKIRGVQDPVSEIEPRINSTEWPPRFWKFKMELKSNDDTGITEAAFVDSRRLGRVRLLDCPGEEIRQHSPLVENGPDPVVDRSALTDDYFSEKLNRRLPIKTALMDQAVVSGIGNWMSDEILYHAKIHPEQRSNTLNQMQIRDLNLAIKYVCSTAVTLLGDAEMLPSDWLFPYRWTRGRQAQSMSLPNEDKIVLTKIGGRTCAFVPDMQKLPEEQDESTPSPKKKSNGREASQAATPSKRKRYGRATEDEEESKKSKTLSPLQTSPNSGQSSTRRI